MGQARRSEVVQEEEVCRYCNDGYLPRKRGEHVFPKGLGGQDTYMSCVCPKCNNFFSGLERELIQKSIVGLMRSVEGIQGYKKAGLGETPFKAQLLLMPDESGEYVYEVRQDRNMKVDIRPQTILFNKKLYVEGDSRDGIETLIKKINAWKAKSRILIVPTAENDTQPFQLFELNTNTGQHTQKEFKSEISTKGAISVNYINPDHKLYDSLAPRLYIDDDLVLRIRARNQDEVFRLIRSILSAADNKEILNSYETTLPEQPIISVGFNFDSVKAERALVKIGLNCIMHYFPEARDDSALDDAIGFVMKETPLILRNVEEKNSIKDSVPDAHTVFFQQGTEFLHVRLSLFQGSMVFSFTIPNLHVMKVSHYSRLVIDYIHKQNKFENKDEFLQSFHRVKT